LVGSLGATTEHRHHDQPALSELIVSNDGIAVVTHFARATKSAEQDVGGHGAVQGLALLREHREA